MNAHGLPPTVDSEGAAAILHVHVETVEQLARQGKLPGFKPGRKWIFPVDALMRWMTAEAEKNMESKQTIDKAAAKNWKRPTLA